MILLILFYFFGDEGIFFIQSLRDQVKPNSATLSKVPWVFTVVSGKGTEHRGPIEAVSVSRHGGGARVSSSTPQPTPQWCEHNPAREAGKSSLCDEEEEETDLGEQVVSSYLFSCLDLKLVRFYY